MRNGHSTGGAATPIAGAVAPLALTDAERAALERLGDKQFFYWVNRGRYDAPHGWEGGH
ncbi:MAG: hypothetical protein ACRDZR_13210 [Acidimicrobiales bacterium]